MNPLIIPTQFAALSQANLSDLDNNFSAISSWANNFSNIGIVYQDQGTANNYYINVPIKITQANQLQGTHFIVIPANTNTGPSTFSVNGYTFQIWNALNPYTPLNPGSINQGNAMHLVFNNNAWWLLNPGGYGYFNNIVSGNGFFLYYAAGKFYWGPLTGPNVTMYNSSTGYNVTLQPSVTTLSPSSYSGYNGAGFYDLGVMYNGNNIVFSLSSFNSNRSYNGSLGYCTINGNYRLLGSLYLNSNGTVAWNTTNPPLQIGLCNYENRITGVVSGNIGLIVLCSRRNYAQLIISNNMTGSLGNWNENPGAINVNSTVSIFGQYSISQSGYFNWGTNWQAGTNGPYISGQNQSISYNNMIMGFASGPLSFNGNQLSTQAFLLI